MVSSKKEKKIASLSVYLDSDIWIDFLWVKKIGEPQKFIKETNKRKLSTEIVDLLRNFQFRVVTSLFHNTEISAWFYDWTLFNKALIRGFNYRDFHRYEEYFHLSNKEKEEINSYYIFISELSFVDSISLDFLDEKALDIFTTLTTIYNIDYMDALHLITAMIERCRFFISGDDILRRYGNKFLREQNLIKKIEIITKRAFRRKLLSGELR